MNRRHLIVSAIAAAALLCAAVPGFAVSVLGSAETFAVLGASTVTNVPAPGTVITGNLGVSPGLAVTGFPPGIVNGGAILVGGSASPAQVDVTTAYNTLAGMSVTSNLSGQDLGSVGTLAPGVYRFDVSAQLTGTLTLDAQNTPGVWWVFQIGSTLTTASNSLVDVINLDPVEQGYDVGLFWQVGSSATLGTGTEFEGNILALTSITLNTGATIANGRALAQTGAVTLDTNVVSIVCPNGGPGYSGGDYPKENVPEPCTLLLIGSALAGLFAWRRRSRSAA